MLKVTSNNVYLTRGDSAVLALSIEDGSGNTYDFSNDTVKMTVKKSCTDKKAVIEKEADENGQFVFAPEDTADLPMGDYWYDVEVTHVEESDDPEVDDVVTVDTVIIPHTFTIGAECTW